MVDLIKVIEWMHGSDTGASSLSLAAVMSGCDLAKIGVICHPHDPGDLGRCIRLLRRFPAWRSRLQVMACTTAAWEALVARWDELEASMDAEVGFHWEKGRSATKTYRLMREILGAVGE